MLLKVCPSGTKSLLHCYNNPVNNVSAQIPGWFYSCYSLSRDDRLAGCWRSSEQCLLLPRSPGDGQATSPSALAAPGPQRRQARWGATSPPPVSMEMRRQAGRGSDSHLYGQRLPVSEESPPCLTAIARKLQSPPPPTPTPPIRSLFFFVVVAVFFKASARREAANSPPHSALAVLPLWGLLGTVVRC